MLTRWPRSLLAGKTWWLEDFFGEMGKREEMGRLFGVGGSFGEEIGD